MLSPSFHDETVKQMGEVRIVLVEPSHPGNIGGAARAMKTMGLDALYLVRPGRFPDPQADWRASQAVDVVAAAAVVDTIDDAIGDCALAIGTSTRERRIPWPQANAEEVAAKIVAGGYEQPVAILFGRETSGLSNEELQRCHLHLTIPANPAYPSLNLAMAVQVVCYELFKARGAASAPLPSDRRHATVTELEAFFAHLETALLRVGFLNPKAPRQVMTRMRRLFGRVGLDETELGMLRGMLSHIESVAKRPDANARRLE